MRPPGDVVRPHYAGFDAWLKGISPSQIKLKREEANRLFRRLGITFTVYGESAGAERLIPFDPIPRIIPPKEWRFLAAGLYGQ